MSLKIQAHSAVDFKSLLCRIVEFKAQDACFMIFLRISTHYFKDVQMHDHDAHHGD